MQFAGRVVCCAVAVVLCVLGAGCQHLPKFSRLKPPKLSEIHVPTPAEIAHELKPHRLHRWNRQRPPSRSSEW